MLAENKKKTKLIAKMFQLEEKKKTFQPSTLAVATAVATAAAAAVKSIVFNTFSFNCQSLPLLPRNFPVFFFFFFAIATSVSSMVSYRSVQNKKKKKAE